MNPDDYSQLQLTLEQIVGALQEQRRAILALLDAATQQLDRDAKK